MNQIAFRLTQGQVMEMMGEGVKGREMPPIGWLLIQHEGSGLSRDAFAKAMGVEDEAIQELIEYVTGEQGEQAESIWQLGVVALKASAIGVEQRLATGWDELEAMALDKLGAELANMRTNGKPEDMLAIATAANKAIRRGKGEGKGGGFGNAVVIRPGDSGASIELNSGDLGTMTLNFSPRIREQLQNANRVIDAEVNKPAQDGIRSLEMLRLKEARKIVDAEEKLQTKVELDERVIQEAHAKNEANKFSLDELFGDKVTSE